MDNAQIAKEIVAALGGRENVRSVAHCATRLRVMVVDEAKIPHLSSQVQQVH